MPARPATLRDPGTPDQIVMEQHSLTHFPSQPWYKMSNLEDVIHHIENCRKSMQLCLNFSLTTGTWVTEALCRSCASSWEQIPLLEPSTRRRCPTPRRWTCPMLLRQQPNGCVTWCTNTLVYLETKTFDTVSTWRVVSCTDRDAAPKVVNAAKATIVTKHTIQFVDRSPIVPSAGSPFCLPLWGQEETWQK